MKLSKLLNKEITATKSAEPNVLMFVDQSSIYWVTEDGYYIFLSGHDGITDYTDDTHIVEDCRYTEKSTEGVGQSGVYWMNQKFNSPFHISDFTNKIQNINTIVN